MDIKLMQGVFKKRLEKEKPADDPKRKLTEVRPREKRAEKFMQQLIVSGMLDNVSRASGDHSLGFIPRQASNRHNLTIVGGDNAVNTTKVYYQNTQHSTEGNEALETQRPLKAAVESSDLDKNNFRQITAKMNTMDNDLVKRANSGANPQSKSIKVSTFEDKQVKDAYKPQSKHKPTKSKEKKPEPVQTKGISKQ
jgi:hypothetical protein